MRLEGYQAACTEILKQDPGADDAPKGGLRNHPSDNAFDRAPKAAVALARGR